MMNIVLQILHTQIRAFSEPANQLGDWGVQRRPSIHTPKTWTLKVIPITVANGVARRGAESFMGAAQEQNLTRRKLYWILDSYKIPTIRDRALRPQETEWQAATGATLTVFRMYSLVDLSIFQQGRQIHR